MYMLCLDSLVMLKRLQMHLPRTKYIQFRLAKCLYICFWLSRLFSWSRCNGKTLNCFKAVYYFRRGYNPTTYEMERADHDRTGDLNHRLKIRWRQNFSHEEKYFPAFSSLAIQMTKAHKQIGENWQTMTQTSSSKIKLKTNLSLPSFTKMIKISPNLERFTDKCGQIPSMGTTCDTITGECLYPSI